MLVLTATTSTLSFSPFLVICYYGDVKAGHFVHPSWKIEAFLHRIIRCILGISMTEVKDQRITNEIVRRNFFDILNIEEQIATQQLTFIGKVTRNSEDHLPNKLLSWWCNHKRRCGGVLHTNKKSIFHNLRLIIPGVDKPGALKKWEHFAINDRYWQHLISGLEKSLTSTPPAPPPPYHCIPHSSTPPSSPHPPPSPTPVNPHHWHQPQRQGQGRRHQ